MFFSKTKSNVKSFYHIKLFNTKINYFNSQNYNPASPSLFSTKNKLKKVKLNLILKLNFLKLKRPVTL